MGQILNKINYYIKEEGCSVASIWTSPTVTRDRWRRSIWQFLFDNKTWLSLNFVPFAAIRRPLIQTLCLTGWLPRLHLLLPPHRSVLQFMWINQMQDSKLLQLEPQLISPHACLHFTESSRGQSVFTPHWVTSITTLPEMCHVVHPLSLSVTDMSIGSYFRIRRDMWNIDMSSMKRWVNATDSCLY